MNTKIINKRMVSNGKRKIVFIIAVVAVLTISTICTFAAYETSFFGINPFTEANHESLMNPPAAYFTEQLLENQRPSIFDTSADIIEAKYLTKDSGFSFTSIGTVEAISNNDCWTVPSFMFNNGDVALLVQANESGWCLDEGEVITLSISQNITDNTAADKDGDRIGIGVVSEGVPTSLTTIKSLSAIIEFAVPETGTYYFYLQNGSAGIIVVDSISLQVSEDSFILHAEIPE